MGEKKEARAKRKGKNYKKLPKAGGKGFRRAGGQGEED